MQHNRVALLTQQGLAFHQQGRLTEAQAIYEEILAIQANHFDALQLLSAIFIQTKQFTKAVDYLTKALQINPAFAVAHYNRGLALGHLKRLDEALASYDQAIAIKPDYAEAYFNRGNALKDLARLDEALISYEKAISIKPDYAEAWSNKGAALKVFKQHREAAKCYLNALEFSVEDTYWLGEAHYQKMLGCDWVNYENITKQIFDEVNQGKKSAEPFGFQAIASSEELLKKCAEIYSNDRYPVLGNLAGDSKYQHNKVRIGYLCGEFRNQATSILMTRVWELHDKTKFEIFAFDNGFDDGSDYRQRIVGAFGNILDISRLSDLEAAKLIQINEIDILVNLNGFFGLPRQGVFSYKPAPIQVNYLGFPGTIGAQYMDYIMADQVVIPEESKQYYVEKLVYLPNSYQANDDQRKIADQQFTRTQLGLPADAFVFACFNNNYKIVPATFDLWCNILIKVQGSVLWLLADNAMAKENLIKEAAARGIDCARLVFAERLPIAEHLARHRYADLFLDTLPYNAHTTASDALWARLPVLTLMGHTFPGRVSASLLKAIGLPELIANTPEEYEALAVELATNRKKLDGIKEKLANNRLTTPLFDAALFTKHLETAYTKMYERYLKDLPPECMNI
jgi:predicted O-linked N-acetylglucosamine transferase (SPINDLY family)